jgi:hypothetical protein
MFISPFFFFPFGDEKTARFDDETRRKIFSRSSSVGIRRIWHLTMQVAVVS